VAFAAPPSGGLAPTRGQRRGCECGSLPAFSRKREGYRTPGASKDAHGRRGPARRHGLSSKRGSSCRGGRGSDARGRARASFDVVAEVDRQWPAQRSGRTSISPDLEAFRDGRLARRSNVRKYAAAGEETLAPSSKRKPHVTVLERGCDPRMAREVVGGRHPGSSCRRLFTERLPTRSRQTRQALDRASEWGPRECDRDVRGTVESGVRGRRRRAKNPRPPAEADQAS